MKSAADSQTKPSIESSVEGDIPDYRERPYVGWIPTVNGRLSFRHIGDTRHPTESIVANLDTDGARLIVAYQRRPLSDILFPSIIHWYRDISGEFWFALTAKSNESALLADRVSGKIHIFKSKEDWRAHANQAVRAQIREINRLRFSSDADTPTLATLAYDRAREKLDRTADIEIEFDLDRNGEVYFSQPEFRERALQDASERLAADEGHDIRKWVADQCYFFLRDATHSHQHHEPHSDTILILQDRKGDDVQWRKNVIFSLHYAIIRFKRDTDARSALRAIGILAYCKSFTACSKARLKARFVDFPEFNDDALMLSLQAKSQEITTAEQIVANRLNAEFARAATARTIAFAFAALLIAGIAILIQPRISQQEEAVFPLLFKVSTFAAENFFSFLGFSVVVIAATWCYTAINILIESKRVGRSLLEASYVRRGRATALLLLLTVATIAITLVLFWPATVNMYDAFSGFFGLFRAH